MELTHNIIYDFCGVKNDSTFNEFPSNRYQFLKSLLDYLEIPYIQDEQVSTFFGNLTIRNLYLLGNSNKFLCAHHDVVDIDSDNANDNSASIINAIMYKKYNPEINVLITDGEEPPFVGIGAEMASNYLRNNNIDVKWILNLELTGKGKYFFIDRKDTVLSRCLEKNFFPPDMIRIYPPFNDSFVFRNEGFESNVLTTFDMKNGKPDFSHLGLSHSEKDNISKISSGDMYFFTYVTLDKIVNNC